MMQILNFVVQMRFPDKLEPQVVRNYIRSAVKKYEKCCQAKDGGYFDGALSEVTFRVTEVPMVEKTDSIRAIVEQIKIVDGHFQMVEWSTRKKATPSHDADLTRPQESDCD